MHDVIIVGGGPAGLSAALLLGRCRRNVLVIDERRPRNAHAVAMHGFLTRDGTNPLDLLEMARRELEPYGVELRDGRVVDIAKHEKHFEVSLSDGTRAQCRKLLLATGMRDELPEIEGVLEMYGVSLHHCPYCDGWEWRDRAIAAFGAGKKGLGLALALKTWTKDVALVTNGDKSGLRRYRAIIEHHNISVHPRKISHLQGKDGRLQSIVFDDGTSLQRDALFFNTSQRQKSDLAAKLGCAFDRNGGVVVDDRERTCVPGVYLAGDATRDVQFLVNAAAEGATAAVAINKEFQKEAGRIL